MQVTVLIVVVVYLLVMLFIGFWSSKQITDTTDFMVAGRRMGPILMAGTLAATEIGGGSSLGVVENASMLGNVQWGLSAAWYIIGMGLAFVILTFLAPRMRNTEVKTVPEYFRRRYGKVAGFFTAITMFIPLIGLTAGQMLASGVIVSAILGVNFKIAVVIIGLIIIAYSVMGGMWSVALTDIVQVGFIVLGMAIAVPFAMSHAGGWAQVKANVPPEVWNLTEGIGSWQGIIAIIVMYTGTFTVGQEAVARFYSARDGKTARQGSIAAAGINIVYAFIPTILGIIMLSMVNQGIVDKAALLAKGARYSLPELATLTMPPLIVGILFAGIISATMSSADSDLLGGASIFGNDIYKTYLRKNADEKEVVMVTRVGMVAIGLFSIGVALSTGNLIKLLMFCFTLRAAGSFFPYVIGLYWKKSSSIAAVASLVIGGLTSVFFENQKAWGLHLSFFGWERQSIIPGMVVSCVLFIVLTLIFPNKKNSLELAND
jgi:SSS family solute:Na+ symporter